MADSQSTAIPARVKDLTGHPPFGRLTVLRYAGNNKYGSALWLCQCRCGAEVVVLGGSLRSGHSSSCGCFNREQVSAAGTTHGKHGTLEYRSWRSMIRRCHCPKDPAYARYEGRGISVCTRWRESLEAFIEDMGPRPSRSYSIERIDNDKGYYKENCCWDTRKAQARNRRHQRSVTFSGRTMCVAAWSEETGIPARTLYDRLNAGWSPERALTQPVDHRRHPKSRCHPS